VVALPMIGCHAHVAETDNVRAAEWLIDPKLRNDQRTPRWRFLRKSSSMIAAAVNVCAARPDEPGRTADRS